MFSRIKKFIFKERIPERIAEDIYIPLADALFRFKNTLYQGDWNHDAEKEIKDIISGPKGTLLFLGHSIKIKVTILNKKDKFTEKQRKIHDLIRKLSSEYKLKPSRDFDSLFRIILPDLVKENPLNGEEIKILFEPVPAYKNLKEILEKIKTSSEASEFKKYVRSIVISSENIKNDLIEDYKRDVSYPEKRRMMFTFSMTLLTIIGMVVASFAGAKLAVEFSQDKELHLEYWYNVLPAQENSNNITIDFFVRNLNDVHTDRVSVHFIAFTSDGFILDEASILTLEKGISKEDGLIEKRIGFQPSRLAKGIQKYLSSENIFLLEGDSFQNNIKIGFELICSKCEGNTYIQSSPNNFFKLICTKKLDGNFECLDSNSFLVQEFN